MCRAGPLRAGERVARAGVVPAAGPHRQRTPVLCGPSQPRHAAAPAATDEGGRPDHRARHAPRRHQHDDVLAPAAAPPGRAARARPPRPGRVEPRVPGRSGHRCVTLRSRNPARRNRATLLRAGAHGPSRRGASTRSSFRYRRTARVAASTWPSSFGIWRHSFPQTRSSRTVRAISPSGCTGSLRTGSFIQSWRRRAARWVMASLLRLPQACGIPTV